MSSKTDFLETQILNHILRNTPYSAPSVIYVGLFTAPPSDAGGGTEVTGGSYARQPVTFAAPVSGTVSNTADVTFPIASADWGNVVAFALFDQSSAGNMMYHAALTAPREVLNLDQFRFPAGQLQVSEA